MLKNIRLTVVIILVALALMSMVITGCDTEKETVELNVAAAASLTDAIQAINEKFMSKNDYITVVANFASSGTLQKQIEQGAPIDVFISASPNQIDALQEQGLILDGTRRDLLNNKVVLVVPTDSTLGITDFMDLLRDDVSKIAIGDPEFVPAGSYARQALELLGIYDDVYPRLILGSDVRQVLGYVENGNVDVGIVYSTDAAVTDGVTIVAEAPAEINDSIVYPVAVIESSKQVEAAREYIDFLCSDEARQIFEEYGFSPISG